MRGIHRWPVNSPHKGPVTQKMIPFDDVIRIIVHKYMLDDLNHVNNWQALPKLRCITCQIWTWYWIYKPCSDNSEKETWITDGGDRSSTPISDRSSLINLVYIPCLLKSLLTALSPQRSSRSIDNIHTTELLSHWAIREYNIKYLKCALRFQILNSNKNINSQRPLTDIDTSIRPRYILIL